MRLYAKGHARNESIDVRISDDQTSLAYAAGIFDGEGCIYARIAMTKTGSMSTFLSFRVAMCSESVIQWLHDQFGGEICVIPPSRTHKKTQFVWQLRGRKIKSVAQALLPFLKEKYQRAKLALTLVDLISQNNYRRLDEIGIQERTVIANQIKRFNRIGEVKES